MSDHMRGSSFDADRLLARFARVVQGIPALLWLSKRALISNDRDPHCASPDLSFPSIPSFGEQVKRRTSLLVNLVDKC